MIDYKPLSGLRLQQGNVLWALDFGMWLGQKLRIIRVTLLGTFEPAGPHSTDPPAFVRSRAVGEADKIIVAVMLKYVRP